ncbi:3',5'-cyclic-AMP phosphodiesterase 4C-like [Bacillus rossius redtenbacheri]|uniref:3',5'-cyclic-AMP phosphodiesterase 4C-like n=1 Tax=Bacillus rossius redtenbacheri TaxID=93214 RepID=UPI002FDEBC29
MTVSTSRLAGVDCLQFVNASAEQLLGLRAGSDLRRECRVEDGELMAQSLADGCEWTGNLVCRELRAASVVRETRVFPVGLPGRCAPSLTPRRRDSLSLEKELSSPERSLVPAGRRDSLSLEKELSSPERSLAPAGRRDSLSLEKELSSPERSLAPAGRRDSLSLEKELSSPERSLVPAGRRDSLSLEKELSSPERSLVPAGEEDSESLLPHSALRRSQLAPLRAQASIPRLSAARLPRPESPPRLTQPRPSVPDDSPPQPQKQSSPQKVTSRIPVFLSPRPMNQLKPESMRQYQSQQGNYQLQLYAECWARVPVTEESAAQDDSMPITLITCRARPSEMLDQVPVYTAIYELQASLPQMTQLLRNAMTWDFEIFQLEELSEQRPLVHMGLRLFRHFGTAATLACDEATLRNWLVLIESGYHRSNPYHNSTHAADVMQGIAFFVAAEKLSAILDPLAQAACLVAAACHDVDHPGKNTAFLCHSEHPLAYLYNDTSVLEMHHASVSFHLTLSDPQVNIFKGLSRDHFKTLRGYIIDMILATEMSKHFDIVQNFDSTIFRAESSMNLQADEVTGLYSPETVAHIRRMMIKCADVSNPTKPVHICTEWALRISEEYFAQTDEEKARNLPVVMPLFDRETCPIPKGQIGFMDFIINDLFKTWTGFVHLPELLKHMEVNFNFWKDLQDQNITTKEEIKSFLNPNNRGHS